jgi:hypothetical protein
MIIIFHEENLLRGEAPNGLRYPRVGGRRQRHFTGINFKPRKLLENAQTPTRRVHAVLGGIVFILIFDSLIKHFADTIPACSITMKKIYSVEYFNLKLFDCRKPSV